MPVSDNTVDRADAAHPARKLRYSAGSCGPLRGSCPTANSVFNGSTTNCLPISPSLLGPRGKKIERRRTLFLEGRRKSTRRKSRFSNRHDHTGIISPLAPLEHSECTEGFNRRLRGWERMGSRSVSAKRSCLTAAAPGAAVNAAVKPWVPGSEFRVSKKPRSPIRAASRIFAVNRRFSWRGASARTARGLPPPEVTWLPAPAPRGRGLSTPMPRAAAC